MKITIPATSAKLYSLFSAGQKTQLRTGRNHANAFHLQIQNSSAQIFCVEKGADAVVATSIPVNIGKFYELIAENLNDIRVISASGNIDVNVVQLNK